MNWTIIIIETAALVLVFTAAIMIPLTGKVLVKKGFAVHDVL